MRQHKTSSTAGRGRRWARAALTLVLPTAVAASTIAALPAAPAQAAANCSTDCVAVTVTPGLDRVKLDVKTTTTAHVAGRIATKDGASTLKAFSAAPTFGTSFAVSVSGLPKQGTVYRYEVYGTDVDGSTWRETGYFSTLIRDLAVHFNQLQITDDSDAGGAGELVGGVQVWSQASGSCSMKALAPLKMTSTTSMSSGSPMTVGTSSDLLCSGIGPAVSVQSQIADDDTDWYDECGDWWPWPWFDSDDWHGSVGGNDCADWNYSDLDMVDPLPEYGAAASTTTFTTTSSEAGHLEDTGPEWVLTGQALFTHRAPAVSLPATTGAAVKLPIALTPKRGEFTVGWTPQSVPGTTITYYLVQWRKAGTSVWDTKTVSAPTTSATIGDLEGGVGYDVQVLAQDSAGTVQLRNTSYVVTQPLVDPTTITGWTSGPATLPPNDTVSFSATVSGDPRPVHLQTRRKGSTTWVTHANLTTAADDTATGSYPVLPGIHEWRLYAPASGFSEAAASETRTVSAKSTISGFSTTKVSVPTGKVIKDPITVNPGAGRKVVVQYKKAGTSKWKNYATVTASDAGRATVKLKAFAGSYSWRAKVASSAIFGTAAITARRVVRGR